MHIITAGSLLPPPSALVERWPRLLFSSLAAMVDAAAAEYKLYVPSLKSSFRGFAPVVVATYNGVNVQVVDVFGGGSGDGKSEYGDDDDGGGGIVSGSDNKLIEKAVRLSPTGKLPVLEVSAATAAPGCEQGRVLFGTIAIARFLATLRTDRVDRLLGASSKERVSVDAWIDFAAQRLELPSCVWWYPVAGYTPYNERAYRKAKADFSRALEVLETALSSKEGEGYLAGSATTFSLADIVICSMLVYPFKLVCDSSYLSQYPVTRKWFLNCVSQPCFRAVVGQVEMCQQELKAG